MTLINKLVPAFCPICYHSVASPFFDGGKQPLATLGWPSCSAEAQNMARHPHDFVQCPNCTHVWNRSFTYDAIPYQNNPNRMFNKGEIWVGHLATTRNMLMEHLSPAPVIIDIGCGEGHFVRGLSAAHHGIGRFIGFDPNSTAETGCGVEFHARYFEPLQDMETFAPDLIVMRHVLEHLTDPAAFVEQLAWGASALDKPVLFFSEMPCIDRVFATKRLADFFYEHPSNFTTQSFRTLMQRGGEVLNLAHGYDGEVVNALVQLKVAETHKARATSALAFAEQAKESRVTIRQQMAALVARGKRVAIWGGTGKAAAFIHQFDADATRFPLVVDSDPDKAGTFVPGTGQEIVFRDVLKERPVDVIVIPTQWRAKDIVAEMEREGIAAQEIYIEHDGRLVDFYRNAHPYR